LFLFLGLEGLAFRISKISSSSSFSSSSRLSRNGSCLSKIPLSSSFLLFLSFDLFLFLFSNESSRFSRLLLGLASSIFFFLAAIILLFSNSFSSYCSQISLSSAFSKI